MTKYINTSGAINVPLVATLSVDTRLVIVYTVEAVGSSQGLIGYPYYQGFKIPERR